MNTTRHDAQRALGFQPTRERRSRAALLVSLSLHLAAAITMGIVLMMQVEVYRVLDAIDVEWFQLPNAPQMVKKRLKTPIEEKPKEDERPLAREVPDKLMKQANNPITEVRQWSPRIVLQDAENNLLPRTQRLPDIATAADLQLSSDVTSLSQLRSLPGATDGQGKVTGRTRVRGSGLGSMLYGNDGTGDGLLGGGGRSGVGDPLNILDFLRGKGDHGRIVYVLDVSASMGAAGLYKLELAKSALIDHMFLLTEQDTFNILTFSANVSRMGGEAVTATADNLSKAKRYLDRFTQQSIGDNNGTNTLGALQAAFAMQPDVVVLLTDGVPTSAYGSVVETDPEKIVQGVRRANASQAGLFIVGLELDVKDSPNAPGAILLKRLADQTGGRIRFVGRDELVRYRDSLATSR